MKFIFSFLKKFPYIAPLLAGVLVFILAISIESESMSNLMLNISASLITIPLVIFTYEVVRERAIKESNKDVSEYVKMNIDRELLSLLNSVSPLVIKVPTPGLEKVLVLMKMDKAQMLKTLKSYAPIAYFLSTDWSYSENQLSDLLSNELVYNNLSVQERNVFIRLIKSLRTLEYATDPRFFSPHGKPNPNYSIIKGDVIDQVTKFENRYLLMKAVKNSDALRVAAFNDIQLRKYRGDLLMPMLANDDGRELLSSVLMEILECVNSWLDSRGDEFILDSKNFKLRRKA